MTPALRATFAAPRNLPRIRDWVKEQQIKISDNKIAEYQVNMLITFVLEDGSADVA